jgi:hypothetical protein
MSQSSAERQDVMDSYNLNVASERERIDQKLTSQRRRQHHRRRRDKACEFDVEKYLSYTKTDDGQIQKFGPSDRGSTAASTCVVPKVPLADSK